MCKHTILHHNFMWMCSLWRLPVAKNHNFGQMLTFGAPVLTPFHRWGPNLVRYSRPTVYAYVPNFVLIGLFCRPLLAKTPIFAVFWTSAFSDVANWDQSEKVEHGCTATMHNYKPYLYGIKIVSVLQRLHGEIGRTNSIWRSKASRVMNRQTNKHYTNR